MITNSHQYPWKLLLIVLVLLFVLASCSGGDDDDGGGNDNIIPDDDMTDDDSQIDDDVADDDSADDDAIDDDSADDDTDGPWDNLSDQLGNGEVRTGVITSENELIGGPRARGMIGDYKIYNSRVEFIIRSTANPAVGWIPYSGNIIDADRARAQGEAGADSLWALEQLVGLARGFLAKQIEVVHYGHNSPAVIRVTGKDGGIDIIDHLLPTWDYGLTITNEYTLYPDTDYLVMKTTLKNETTRDRHVLIADVPLWGDETKIFTPRAGYNLGDVDLLASLRWVGGISRLRLPVSYAIATIEPQKKFYVPYIDGDILPLIEGTLHLTSQGEASYERLFIVGTGDTGLIQSTINAYDQNSDYGTLKGTLHVGSGDDPTGVEIVVTDTVRPEGSNYVGVAWPDASGAFSLQLAPGTYNLVASGDGRVDSAPVTVEVTAGNDADTEISIDQPGYFAFNVKDGNNALIPCMFTFQTGFNAPRTAGIVHRIWTATGQGTESVLPGEYTVTVSRGYEYEIDAQNVTIATGATATFTSVIERVVNTTGYMSADFHDHTEFSVDSQANVQHRIVEFMAEGIEMPVVTDHDTVSDLMPYVEAINAQAWIHPARGMEVSPVWGHFNTWPLSPPSTANDYFGIRLANFDANGNFVSKRNFLDMWTQARNEYGAQIIKINHPRSGTSGWFNTVGYDPTIGVSSVNPDLWSDDFDAIEVWNSGTNSDDLATLIDWFSFLDQGYKYTMLGGSDSHGPNSMLGNPRDLFSMPTDDPSAADPQDMVDSLLNQRSESCSGPFVSFSINGHAIGSFVTGIGGDTVNLDIVIQAPSWIDVDYLRVYSNGGEIIAEQAVSGSGVVRFDGFITVTSDADRWLVVEAGHSTATLSPVNPGEPVFTITNPIWVDFDGNGTFDPPGIL